MKDKLWFYFTYKYQDNKIWVASAKFPDGSQAYRKAMGNYSGVGRVTWAATTKDKFRVYVEKQYNGEFYNGFNTAANDDAPGVHRRVRRGMGTTGEMDPYDSNKLMFEAGISYYTLPYEQNYTSAVNPFDLPRLEATTNQLTVAAGYTIPPYKSTTQDYSSVASASYVTGSHAMKTGMTMGWGENSRTVHAACRHQHAGQFNVPGAPIPRWRSPTHRRRHTRR